MKYMKSVIGLLILLLTVSVAAGQIYGDNRYYEDYQRDYYFDESDSFSRTIDADYEDPYYYSNNYYGYPYGSANSGFSDYESYSSSTTFERHDSYTREFRSDFDYYTPSYRYNRYNYYDDYNYGSRYPSYYGYDYYGGYDQFGRGTPNYNRDRYYN